MIHFLACTAALCAAAAALWGWGGVARRWAGLPPQGWAPTAALGLALVLAVGGVLNLARLAWAPALWAVVGAGLVLAVPEWRAGARKLPQRADLLAGGLVAALVGFAIATQLPPALFNHYDDLEKYFAHPVRMLATGTLLGSPVDSLGAGTLGGAAFLHGIVLSLFPIGYVYGVDAVLGFALVLGLGAAAGTRLARAGAPLVVLALACIEPQLVNVSPLFLGAALVAACILLAASAPHGLPPPLALGLLYAGLVALKPTLALFPALHLPLLALAAVAGGAAPRAAFAWAVRAGIASALALAPWIAVHLPNVLDAGAAPVAIPEGAPEGLRLFAFTAGAYGASVAYYVTLAAAGIGAAATALRRPGIAASALAAAGVLALALALAPLSLGRDANLRYAVPILLGAVPAVIALAAPRRAALALLAGLALLFLPSAIDRHARALEHRTLLAFVDDGLLAEPGYREHQRYALSAQARADVRALQARVPEGEPVLASILLPFHLDFARNPIHDAEPAGWANPWARVPADVRYVIWQRAGWGVRSELEYRRWRHVAGRAERVIATRARDAALWLEAEAAAGEVLYADERYVVFRRRP